MDDGDPKKNSNIKRKGEKTTDIQGYFANASNVFSPVWLRRIIQINNGSEWIILGSRFSFLFNFRIFLVVVYLAYEILK